MGHERIGIAVQRIEAALARIDSASDHFGSAQPSGDVLAAAKDSLKRDLAGTLNDLDMLIESMER